MRTKDQDLRIIFEDANLLIVDKPIGMLSHPDVKLHEMDLLTKLKVDHSDARNYAVTNRLDFNTSGLVIIGKNLNFIKELNKASIDNKIRKTYLCAVMGYFPYQEAILEAYLLKDSTQSKVRISETPVPNAQKILTKYTVLKELNNMCLVEVELLTGKTHQIRAHLASVGHPLLGDPLYGFPTINKKVGLKTQALCAYQLHFGDFGPSNPLSYLNGRNFKTDRVPFMHLFVQK